MSQLVQGRAGYSSTSATTLRCFPRAGIGEARQAGRRRNHREYRDAGLAREKRRRQRRGAGGRTAASAARPISSTSAVATIRHRRTGKRHWSAPRAGSRYVRIDRDRIRAACLREAEHGAREGRAVATGLSTAASSALSRRAPSDARRADHGGNEEQSGRQDPATREAQRIMAVGMVTLVCEYGSERRLVEQLLRAGREVHARAQ